MTWSDGFGPLATKDPRVTQEQAESIFENFADIKHFKDLDAGHEPYLAKSPGEWASGTTVRSARYPRVRHRPEVSRSMKSLT